MKRIVFIGILMSVFALVCIVHTNTVFAQIGGDEGCTPGFWKQNQHFIMWVGFDQDDDFETVFGVDASFTTTLLEALEQGGSGEYALGRHAVAALLNAANPNVDYFTDVAGVIALVQDAYATGNFGDAKILIEYENEMECPLTATEVTICHRDDTTISVGINAVPAHLRHGDVLGPCPD